jgi:hypothetical protein
MSVRRASPRCARHSAPASPGCDDSRSWPSRFCVMPGWSSDMTISLFSEMH